jgi:predicted transcriptional regulator
MSSASSAGLPMDALLIKGSLALLTTLVKLNRTALTATVLLYLSVQEDPVDELQICTDTGLDINRIASATGALVRSGHIECMSKGRLIITTEGQLEVMTMIGAMTLTAQADAIAEGNAIDVEADRS